MITTSKLVFCSLIPLILAKSDAASSLSDELNRLASESSPCGCDDCTDTVLNTMAGDYSCGSRINYLKNYKGYSEVDACKKVSGVEFPGICGPMCDPDRCNLAPSPPCGCDDCTDTVLNTMAGDYSCGSRINYLKNYKGYSEVDACEKISGVEFPGICGPMCDPDRCGGTDSPTKSPTAAPTKSPTAAPTKSPTAVPAKARTSTPSVSTPSPCGCDDCTDTVLDAMAGDYSCGSRIKYLKNYKGYSEVDACKMISGVEFPGICGPMCDPDRCNLAPSPPCGCDDCTDTVLDTMAGDYSCGSRINYLKNYKGYSEVDACKKISGVEFPGICGPMCDPDRCGLAPSPVTPVPTFSPGSSSPLYCFPPENARTRYTNMWAGYTVELKEGDVCGPGDNRFSTSSVARAGNELTLKFQKNGNNWEGSEVRVVLPNEEFTYGKYRFHVKTVNMVDLQGTTSTTLPKDLVLGLFSWDPTDRYDVHQNWNHEVDIEISRWGSESNADTQFLMQPPGSPQMYRFYSGSEPNYDQSNHWHSFNWLPGGIFWESTAGGGHTHGYTTDAAVRDGRVDYVQCLPAAVEVRFNLWNMFGNQAPSGLSDNQHIEVVIDDFVFEPSPVSFIASGEYCSKHCQCEGDCINGRCAHL